MSQQTGDEFAGTTASGWAQASGMGNEGPDTLWPSWLPDAFGYRDRAEQRQRSDENVAKRDSFVWHAGRNEFVNVVTKDYQFNPPLDPTIRLNQSRLEPYMDWDAENEVSFLKETNIPTHLGADTQNNFKWDNPRDAKAQNWRLGMLLNDGKFSPGYHDDAYRYGFRFLYNPSNVSFSTQLLTTINPDTVNNLVNSYYLSSAGGGVMSMELLLNRIPEVSGKAQLEDLDTYDEDANGIPNIGVRLRQEGTLVDIDYLFRTSNGAWSIPDHYTPPRLVNEADLENVERDILGPNYEQWKRLQEESKDTPDPDDTDRAGSGFSSWNRVDVHKALQHPDADQGWWISLNPEGPDGWSGVGLMDPSKRTAFWSYGVERGWIKEPDTEYWKSAYRQMEGAVSDETRYSQMLKDAASKEGKWPKNNEDSQASFRAEMWRLYTYNGVGNNKSDDNEGQWPSRVNSEDDSFPEAYLTEGTTDKSEDEEKKEEEEGGGGNQPASRGVGSRFRSSTSVPILDPAAEQSIHEYKESIANGRQPVKNLSAGARKSLSDKLPGLREVKPLPGKTGFPQKLTWRQALQLLKPEHLATIYTAGEVRAMFYQKEVWLNGKEKDRLVQTLKIINGQDLSGAVGGSPDYVPDVSLQGIGTQQARRPLPDDGSGSIDWNDKTAKRRADLIWKTLKEAGWSDSGAAGALGNLSRETGGTFDPEKNNPGDGNCNMSVSDYHPDSIGIAQWNCGRALGLKDFCDNWKDLECQIKWMIREINTKDEYAATKKSVKKSEPSAREQASVFASNYEGCRACEGGGSENEARRESAQEYYKHYKGKGVDVDDPEDDPTGGGSDAGAGSFGSDWEAIDSVIPEDEWNYDFPTDIEKIKIDGKFGADYLIQGIYSKKTGDIGFIIATPLWLTLGPSMRYYGMLKQMSYQHIMFSRQMVPMLTKVQIGFERLFMGKSSDANRLQQSAAMAAYLQGDIFEPDEPNEGKPSASDGVPGSGGALWPDAGTATEDWKRYKKTLGSHYDEEQMKNVEAVFRALGNEPSLKGWTSINTRMVDDKGYPDHPSGLALDIMICEGCGIYGESKKPTEEQKKVGTTIGNYFDKHWADYGTDYQLWNRQARTAMGHTGNTSANEGWRSPADDHVDHVHILVRPYDYSPVKVYGKGDENWEVYKGKFWERAAGSGANPGGWMTPYDGIVTDIEGYNFGAPRDFCSTTGESPRQHGGQDFSSPDGEPLRAMNDGVVTQSLETERGGLQYVSVKYPIADGSHVEVAYLHVKNRKVKKGDDVKAGEVLAYVSDTGSRGKIHLHMDVHFGTTSSGQSAVPWGCGQSSTGTDPRSEGTIPPLEFLAAVFPNVTGFERKDRNQGSGCGSKCKGFDPNFDDKWLNHLRYRILGQGSASNAKNPISSRSFAKSPDPNPVLLGKRAVETPNRFTYTYEFRTQETDIYEWVGNSTEWITSKPDLYLRLDGRLWAKSAPSSVGQAPRSSREAILHLAQYVEMAAYPDDPDYMGIDVVDWSDQGMAMVARAYGYDTPGTKDIPHDVEGPPGAALRQFRWLRRNHPEIAMPAPNETSFGYGVPIGAILYWDEESGSATGFGRVGIAAGYRDGILLCFMSCEEGTAPVAVREPGVLYAPHVDLRPAPGYGCVGWTLPTFFAPPPKTAKSLGEK